MNIYIYVDLSLHIVYIYIYILLHTNLANTLISILLHLMRILEAAPLLTQRRAEQREHQQQEETAAMIKAEAIKALTKETWTWRLPSGNDSHSHGIDGP